MTTKPSELALAAEWLLAEVERNGVVHQDHAVSELESRFGNAVAYINDAGNPAIAKQVLTAFKAISPDVVWSRSERCWRKREKGDEPGRNQP